jgi:heptosyltransferase-2
MDFPRRIVVRSPNYVGDHVMARGAYAALRRQYHSAHIVLVAPEGVAGLKYPEYFDDVQIIAGRKSSRGIFRLARQLKLGKFDLAVLMTASLRGAFPFFLARIPRRVGFKSDGCGIFLTGGQPWEGVFRGRHKAEVYSGLAEFVTGVMPPRDLTPPLEPAPARENLVILAPGASIALREWPHVAALIAYLRRAYPQFRVALVGGPNEIKWRDLLRSEIAAGAEDWIGKTTLTELVELCRRAKLVVANDSGVGHVAASLAQAPTLVLFGPGNPAYIKPVGPLVYEVWVDKLACRPCEKSYCRAPYGHQQCLQALSIDEVARHIAMILG